MLEELRVLQKNDNIRIRRSVYDVMFDLIRKCITPKICIHIIRGKHEYEYFKKLTKSGLIKKTNSKKTKNGRICIFYQASPEAIEALKNWDSCLVALDMKKKNNNMWLVS